jgi:type IV pilus assembly protein PilW
MNNSIQRQRGLTLIELMISMTLSLIVMFAVGSILISSNQAASVSDTLADSQESGRFAVDYINRQLLKTGYDPEDTGLIAFGNLCADASETVCIRENDSGTGDRIAVRRVAEVEKDPADSAKTIPKSNAVTCYGSGLLDADDNDITENVTVTDLYWVEVDNNGLSNLRCQSFDENGTVRANPGDNFGDSQALAAGVLSMHVLFGQSNSAPINDTLNVSAYFNANQVTDWANVYAIRIGFLTQALSNTEAPSWDQKYIVMDSLTYEFNDQTARQVFTTTVTLLN